MQTLPLPVLFPIKVLYTHVMHFDPEDGGSVYLQNISNIRHIHTV
jgi:hypothetical protein